MALLSGATDAAVGGATGAAVDGTTGAAVGGTTGAAVYPVVCNVPTASAPQVQHGLHHLPCLARSAVELFSNTYQATVCVCMYAHIYIH